MVNVPGGAHIVAQFESEEMAELVVELLNNKRDADKRN